MKIRMRTQMAGPGGNASPGQVVDVETKAGRELVAGGYAEALDGPRKPAGKRRGKKGKVAPEAAAMAQPETAAMPAAEPHQVSGD